MIIKRILQALTLGKQDTGTEYRQDKMELSFEEKADPVVQQLTDAIDAAHDHIKLMQGKLDSSDGAKKKAEGERDQMEEDAKKKTHDHAELDKMADVRADLKAVAAHIGCKDFSDKSNEQITAMVVAQHNPDLDVSKLDASNIAGRFGMICDGIKAENKGLGSLAALKAATGPITKTDVGNPNTPTPRQEYVEDVADMHGKTEAEVKADWATKEKARQAA